MIAIGTIIAIVAVIAVIAVITIIAIVSSIAISSVFVLLLVLPVRVVVNRMQCQAARPPVLRCSMGRFVVVLGLNITTIVYWGYIGLRLWGKCQGCIGIMENKTETILFRAEFKVYWVYVWCYSHTCWKATRETSKRVHQFLGRAATCNLATCKRVLLGCVMCVCMVQGGLQDLTHKLASSCVTGLDRMEGPKGLGCLEKLLGRGTSTTKTTSKTATFTSATRTSTSQTSTVSSTTTRSGTTTIVSTRTWVPCGRRALTSPL